MNTKEVTINGNTVGSYSDYMNNSISGIIYESEQLEQESPELREQFIKHVLIKERTEKFHYEYKVSIIDTANEVEEFLNSPDKSKTTLKDYTSWLRHFLSWYDTNQIDYRKITRIQAEKYVRYLSEHEYKPGKKYASNSINSMVLCVSSFYQFLYLRHTDTFTMSHFHKIKLPKRILERREDIVLEDDIKKVQDKFQRLGRKEVVCALDILCKYGYRVGIFEQMQLDKDGNFMSVSKEQNIRGKFTREETKKILETWLLKMRKCTLQNIILRYTTKLFESGKIRCPFSVHDLRHYHIWKYGKDLTMAEFVIFSRRFHKNIQTTIDYIERYNRYYEEQMTLKR
jgi:integrase